MTAVGKLVVLNPGEGTRWQIGPDSFRTKGSAKERSESFSVIEYEGAPGVPGPPAHAHRTFEEAWYILEGEVRFESSGKSIVGKEGTYLYVPKGVPHRFEVQGTAPARWVGIFSPGRFVALIEELAAIIPANGPPDPKKIVALFSKYDTELV